MTSLGPSTRRYAHGAEFFGDGASFRFWAERAGSVGMVLGDGREIALAPEAGGWFWPKCPLSIPETAMHIASTAARRSQIPRPGLRFPGPRAGRPRRSHGLPLARQRLAGHPGGGRCSTRCTSAPSRREGTWAAAAERLPHLAALGVTVFEMMPIAEFPRPLRLGLRRRRILRADAPLRHARRPARASSTRRTRYGIGVILDVVYNHFGPDGNYLAEFSDR